MRIEIQEIPAYGTISKSVATMQGILGVKVDGVHGNGTRAALIAFQKKHGLKPAIPGNPGPKTLQLLGLVVAPKSPTTGFAAVTKELEGRQDRHLHPSLRLMIEGRCLVDGKWPQFVYDRNVQLSYSYVMRQAAGLGVREVGRNNFGPEVGYVQGTTGKYTPGGNGDAWCNDWGNIGVAILEDQWGVESPVIGNPHCMTTLKAALKIPGLVSETPEAGTLALGKHGKEPSISGAGHSMPVVQLNADGKTMITSEGNTSIKNMTDGDGSGLKTRNYYKNGDIYTRGWVRLYPNNKVPAA